MMLFYQPGGEFLSNISFVSQVVEIAKRKIYINLSAHW